MSDTLKTIDTICEYLRETRSHATSCGATADQLLDSGQITQTVHDDVVSQVKAVVKYARSAEDHGRSVESLWKRDPSDPYLLGELDKLEARCNSLVGIADHLADASRSNSNLQHYAAKAFQSADNAWDLSQSVGEGGVGTVNKQTFRFTVAELNDLGRPWAKVKQWLDELNDLADGRRGPWPPGASFIIDNDYTLKNLAENAGDDYDQMVRKWDDLMLGFPGFNLTRDEKDQLANHAGNLAKNLGSIVDHLEANVRHAPEGYSDDVVKDTERRIGMLERDFKQMRDKLTKNVVGKRGN